VWLAMSRQGPLLLAQHMLGCARTGTQDPAARSRSQRRLTVGASVVRPRTTSGEGEGATAAARHWYRGVRPLVLVCALEETRGACCCALLLLLLLMLPAGLGAHHVGVNGLAYSCSVGVWGYVSAGRCGASVRTRVHKPHGVGMHAVPVHSDMVTMHAWVAERACNHACMHASLRGRKPALRVCLTLWLWRCLPPGATPTGHLCAGGGDAQQWGTHACGGVRAYVRAACHTSTQGAPPGVHRQASRAAGLPLPSN